MLEKIVNAAKNIVNDIKDTYVGLAKSVAPALIPGVPYFYEASNKIPDITQQEQVVLAGAFGLATMVAVEAGEEIGGIIYSIADTIALPDEDHRRAGLFTASLAGGMTGAVMATTLAFNMMSEDQPNIFNVNKPDIVEFFEEIRSETTEDTVGGLAR